jgi:hypothetical protein
MYSNPTGSSEQTVARAVLSPEVIAKLDELSIDEPLPELKPSNRIRLLAQSPRKILLYWNLARDPLETLRRAFGDRAEEYSLTIKFVDLASGDETFYSATPNQSQWFDVLPAREYRAEIGLYAHGRPFIRLIESNRSMTPRAGVAQDADPIDEWHLSPTEFSRVLDESGYSTDAVEVALEAMQKRLRDVDERRFGEEFPGATAFALHHRSVAELRTLIANLISEMQSATVGTTALHSVERALQTFQSQAFAGMDETEIAELLRLLFGFETEDELRQLDKILRRSQHASIRISSESFLLSRPFRFWMPSMSGKG